MRLQHLHVDHFKRFEQVDVPLEPLNCLVGPNNSGKTTLLQALALFDFCVHHCLERKNGGLELRRRTIPPEAFYVLPVVNPTDLWPDRKTMAARRQQVITIRVVFDEQREVTASVKLDFNRFGIEIESTDASQEWLEELVKFRIEYLPVFSVFLAQEERRSPAIINDELARGRVHGVIRNLLLDLKLSGRETQLLEILKRSFPTLTEMKIEFDEVSDRYISVVYKEVGRPKEFDVFSAGSGFQQFLYLFGFILLKQPTVILLDEPDKHLHGTLQQALLQELHRLIGDGKQVLLATHSRDLIQSVSPEHVLSVEEDGVRKLRVDFDVYDTLDKLGSIEPTQLPIILAYQRVLIVEDQADQRLLSTFCSKCLGDRIWRQVERRLAICYSKGNPYLKNMSLLRGHLQQMITMSGKTLKAFVISDRDYFPDRASLLASLPTKHLSWHVWERAEIENYLLCPEAIVRLLREGDRHPVLEESLFLSEFEKLIDASRDSANDRLVDGFSKERKMKEKKWDAAAMSKKAREYLSHHWDANKLGLADAKDKVLPGIKRWLQEHQIGQFSNQRLAETLEHEDLPEEVHRLAKRLAEFAGVPLSKTRD